MRLFLLTIISVLATSVQVQAETQHSAVEDYPPDVKPIIEQRCMVCHGCYDAPCQLKMDDWIGLNRGASKDKVYDGSRLLTANMTRLYEDALTEPEWRAKGFYPVLERKHISQSVLYKMLALKEKYPLPTEGVLPDKFDFSLNRKQSCPKPNQYGLYNQNRPYQGMPFGFPGVNPDQMATLASWLNGGAEGVKVAPRPAAELKYVAQWEAFFNGPGLKQQLMSRYIYEHLFIGNLYFDHLDQQSGWYKLVRSRTAPGQPIDIIASRRPYDDPGVKEFYYRLQLRQTTILDKRHMPYVLNPARQQRWQQLFLDKDYTVNALPAYKARKDANPFVTFEQLPVDTRYKFMLDEAHFTIMGFIKGPVCRGQVALNVIDDHFWVAFMKPNNLDPDQQAKFLAQVSGDLRIPRPKGGLVVTLLQWGQYGDAQKKYLAAEAKKIAETVDQGVLDVNLDLVWNGGPERNPNASLTVFRHGDSASVVKGLVGQQPKTMWFIDYSLLERIHYLLVAGFDVYGNVGHQLESRLYMDFLRMEGEQNFLLFLPKDQRAKLRDYWYRGAEQHVKEFIASPATARYQRDSDINYKTDNPKRELMGMLEKHITGSRNHRYQIDTQHLGRLMQTQGAFFSYLPEVAFVQVLEKSGRSRNYSLLHNRGHSNNAQIFDEQKRMLPTEDTLTVVDGFIGAYPNMFFQITEAQLEGFSQAIKAMANPDDYTRLVERYGVRRTAPWFWKLSDEFFSSYKKSQPQEAGLFDLNRYQNR
ncbi:MAG: fatty acid cis/trans isomerase [Halieaceae bacterium]